MTSDNEARIGVFVCHCGVNIGGIVDVPSVVEYAKHLPNVVYADDKLYTCSDESLSKIKEAINEQRLNRVIVASCTPRTHELLFRAACEEANLNPYLFEFVNIREQCSWVHQKKPESATEKAKDLIRMGVARAQLLEPQKDIEVEVTDKALVIGGGIAGIQAALSLANQGFKVYLVEKNSELGGMLRKLNKLAPRDLEASKILEPRVKAVKENKKIELLTSSTVKNVEGYIGNFEVVVSKNGEDVRFQVGTIIVATGAVGREPTGFYGYGKYENVITQLQLEQLLKDGKLKSVKRVVMIQCVGAREKSGITYCSRICCLSAIKNALLIKEQNPKAEIYILHRGIQLFGQFEEYYQKSYPAGVRYVRLLDDRLPDVVAKPDNKLTVTFYNALHGREMTLESDLVVLSTPLVQHPDGEKISHLLRVPLGSDKFFLEAHAKLRPVDFATDGIYVCGTAHGPKTIPDSIAQALAAASHASIPMANKKAKAEAITAYVDEEICIGCGFCESVCPFGAVKLVKRDDGKWVSKVNEVSCKGCGVCVAGCPALALTMRHFKPEYVLAQIKSAFPPPYPRREEFEPRILAFTCNWCSYAGADLAGVSRIQYPSNVRIIRLMCSGRVDPIFVLEAFRNGADGVLISGCHPGDCHYISGNKWAKARSEALKKMLSELNIEPNRLKLQWVSASEGKKFAETVTDLVEELKQLGPTRLSIAH
ncbi:MAG: hydrogenase iron-sulfur subunit [Candidatus Bathyarchaeota archaeon]